MFLSENQSKYSLPEQAQTWFATYMEKKRAAMKKEDPENAERLEKMEKNRDVRTPSLWAFMIAHANEFPESSVCMLHLDPQTIVFLLQRGIFHVDQIEYHQDQEIRAIIPDPELKAA